MLAVGRLGYGLSLSSLTTINSQTLISLDGARPSSSARRRPDSKPTRGRCGSIRGSSSGYSVVKGAVQDALTYSDTPTSGSLASEQPLHHRRRKVCAEPSSLLSYSGSRGAVLSFPAVRWYFYPRYAACFARGADRLLRRLPSGAESQTSPTCHLSRPSFLPGVVDQVKRPCALWFLLILPLEPWEAKQRDSAFFPSRCRFVLERKSSKLRPKEPQTSSVSI